MNSINSQRTIAVIVAFFAVMLLVTNAASAAVTVSTAATQNMSCSGGVCSPTAANAVLNVGDLTSMLASSNVTVNTGTGSLPAQVEDIIVAATFNWASVNALTLDAYRSVTFTAPVAVNGAAPVSLTTDDGGSGGSLSFTSGGSLSFLGTTNNLSIDGKDYALENTLATLVAAIKHKKSGHYALSTNYDAGNDGTYKASPITTKFKGTLNGLGNTISSLAIKDTSPTIGLFSYVAKGGTVVSLQVAGANVQVGPGTSAGVVAGVNYGTLFNVFASGQITGGIGQDTPSVLGGLIGDNVGTLIDSSSNTTVSATGRSKNPGFVDVGGLAGENSGTIGESYATGGASVSGQTVSTFLGGLVGFNNGPIVGCYANGATTTALAAHVGGLIGENAQTVSQSYSIGLVSGGAGSVLGGLIAYDGSAPGSLTNTYWDITTSGITNLSQGAGSPANDPGITGETTAQLQSGLPPGFDPTIWAENSLINNGLPYLIANPPQ